MDWSSFVPDVIAALVMGLLVGLALVLFERSRQRAEKRTHALGAWLMVAPRIERIAARNLPYDTTDYGARGSSATRIRDIADGHPVELWQQILNREDILRLIELLGEFDNFEAHAERAERLLESALYFKGITADIGGMVGIVARAQTYADSDEQLLVQFSGPNEHLRKFIPVALALRDHEGYAAAERDYVDARTRTVAALGAFVEAVRAARAAALGK